MTNGNKACITDRALRNGKEFAETCVAKRDYHENEVRSFRGGYSYRGSLPVNRFLQALAWECLEF